MTSTEESLLEWLRREALGLGAELIGDDGAILPGGKPFVVTVDTQIEDVHFPQNLKPERIAERLVAVNLSDLAAMGARPEYAFLSLSAPPEFDRKAFFRAILKTCREFDFRLAGGDLSSHSRIVGVLTFLGQQAGERWLERSAARSGQQIWVGGNLGNAALGLELVRQGFLGLDRTLTWQKDPAWEVEVIQLAEACVRHYIHPSPQLELGWWLANQAEGAAMDLSDGLTKDLHRLCHSSEVGAAVELALVPLAPGFRALSRYLGLDWRQASTGHGDDYVLLFTLPPGLKPPDHFDCHRIGQVTASTKIEWIVEEGQRIPMSSDGWDHLRD